MRLRDLGEDRFIKDLLRRFPVASPRVVAGIGDDASVTVERGGRYLLATTDVLIEGVHFKAAYTPPYLLGRKALSVSLSDIAAMGGEPLFFLVSIAIPPDSSREFTDELYRGLRDSARPFKTALAGGNTSSSPIVMVSTTVIGEALPGEAVLRKGARPGDIVYLTGTAGDSALGLTALKRYGKRALAKGPYRASALKHLDPAPRIEAGRALAKGGLVTAMIDVSDGVALDLKRLAEMSRTGAVIEAGRVPLSREMKAYAGKAGEDRALLLALTGGEDYELLFTSPPGHSRKVAALSKKLKLPITHIGTITRGRGVKVLKRGVPFEVKKPGFEHF